MKNLLMINPIIRPEEKPMCIPHGLAILANIIRDKVKDINITFLDINGYRYDTKTVQKIIQKTDFDTVFIGGLIPIYRHVIAMSDYIKSVNPDATIVAGGSVAMSVPKELLTHSKVDIICTGEGEITAVELLQKDYKDIKGICYKENGKIKFNEPRPYIQNLDKDSALPAYDLLPMELYLNTSVVGMGREIDFITTRSCIFHCTFCYQPFGHKQRLHSVGFLRNAIQHLKDNYDIDFITFMDDEFMANKSRLIEFCKMRNKYFPELLWSATGRANITARNEDLVKLVKKSGCTEIDYGFESASPRMLKSMRKAQTPEMMKKTVEISRKHGLPVAASFIIGMPGETEKSCKETIDFCLENNISLVSLMFATPYPGTEIFNFALKTKRISDVHKFALSLKDARDFTVNLTDDFTDEELINKRTEMIETTQENYENYITRDEIKLKLRDLYGPLMDKQKFDDKDLEHRMKFGGVSMF